MPKAIPVELRQRIVAAYLAGEGTYDEIAARFMVAPRSVSRYVKLHDEGEELKPKPHSGGRAHQKLFEEHNHALERWVEEDPHIRIDELCSRLLSEFGITYHPSSLCNHLNHVLKLRRKKTR